MTAEILVFDLAGRHFGLRTSVVREVVRAATLNKPPADPRLVEGLLNLRGKIVPVVDLRTVLGLPPKKLGHQDHFVVAEQDDLFLALRVDRASELVHVPDSGDRNATDAEDGPSRQDHRDTHDGDSGGAGPAGEVIEFTASADQLDAGVVHVLHFPKLLSLAVTELSNPPAPHIANHEVTAS